MHAAGGHSGGAGEGADEADGGGSEKHGITSLRLVRDDLLKQLLERAAEAQGAQPSKLTTSGPPTITSPPTSPPAILPTTHPATPPTTPPTTPPALHPVPSPTRVSQESWCREWQLLHSVVPRQTWGTITPADKVRWRSSGCDGYNYDVESNGQWYKYDPEQWTVVAEGIWGFLNHLVGMTKDRRWRIVV